MSDLRYILDTGDEDDHRNDKYSRQPSLSGPAHSHNPSSTAKTSDGNHPSSDVDPDKSQPRRRGPLSRSPPRPTTAASPTTTAADVDKSSPSRSPLVERRSVDSTESMDPIHYGTFAPVPSSSNMPPSSRASVPSRPMSSATGEGNLPVRLTPVTGRVSRAKKGMPVHICEICKPSKTFTRAEHLRRHQLGHRPAAFQCSHPGCGKTFHRQDLLTRHAQRHEQDDRSGTDMTGSPSRRPSYTPGGSTPPITVVAPPIMPGSGPEEISATTPYLGNGSPYPTSHRSSISGQGPISPSAHSPRSISTGTPHSLPHEYTASPAHHVPHSDIQSASMEGQFYTHSSYGVGFEPRRPPPFPYIALEELRGLEIPNNNFSSLDSPWPSSASNSPYSTPDGTMIRRFDSPSADVPSPDMFYVSHHYPSPQQPVYQPPADYNFADDAGYYDVHSQPFSVRSLTPPTVTLSAQTAENLVTLGASVPEPAALLSRQKRSAALLSPYTDAAFLTALVPSAPALNAIPRYLDVYWKRFDTLFPLVHRRSLETADDPVLKCSMAALGSQFLQSKEDRANSHILHGLASQEARRRPQWSIHVMQAILLCEFYGRFRGSKAATRASDPFQSLYSRVAAPLAPVDHDTPVNNDNTSHRHWDRWIVTESRRRLLAACFVLDVHTSMYHEHSILHHFLTATPPIPLIKPTQHLWAAQTPKAWEDLLSSAPDQLEPVSLADEEITASHVSAAPPLDVAVYMASEALRLPRRSPASSAVDVSAVPDADVTRRMRELFPESAVANTYLALHHTPVRDLLAVSGDSWLFSRKLLDPEDFQRRKVGVRAWRGSTHAGAASAFAAKALLGFFDANDNIATLGGAQNPTEGSQQVEEGSWDTSLSNISDSWALYVCALICWCTSHRTTRGARDGDGNSNSNRGGSAGFSSSATPHLNNDTITTNETTTRTTIPTSTSTRTPDCITEQEEEAKGWLKTMVGLGPGPVLRNTVRTQRREALGVVAMVRRRLESDTAGAKCKLLIDAIRVLKSLEGDPNRARF